MLNENRTNTPLWKDKLDGLENLPAEALDKAAAWNKLHERLQQKRSSKRIVRYCMAAACLLLVIIISGIFETTKEIPVVKTNIREKASLNLPHGMVVQIAANDTLEVVSEERVEKKQNLPPIVQMNKTVSPITDKESFIDTTLESNTVLANVDYSIPADTSNIAGASVQSKQRKFRVIHINELGKPVEDVRFARNEGFAFPIKINNRDNLSSPNSHKAPHDILKINFSPQN